MLYYSLLDISAITDIQTDNIRQKIARHFTDGDSLKRKESVIARALLCHMLDKCFGVRNFTVDSDKNGKPVIVNSDLYFNLSHSGNFVLCVCGDENIGCDIEKIKACNFKVAERFFCENECRLLSASDNFPFDFMRMWTLKESVLKFSGKGISGGLDSWDFSGYYKDDKFMLDGLMFLSFEKNGYYISVCSRSDELIYVEAFIGDIITDL